jgi:hypothetical protein
MFYILFFWSMKPKVKEIKSIKSAKDKSSPIDSDFIKLGKRMRELRIKRGYKSFEAFAYDNDLPRVLYGNYEKGVGNITYKNLLKVIKALDFTMKDFFNEGFD